MNDILKKLKNKKNLTFEESKTAFSDIMSGEVSEETIYDFLSILLSTLKFDAFN